MKTVRSQAACVAAFLALVTIGGCAVTGAQPNPRDPWEGLNRNTHAFNEGLDSIVLKPVATLYREKVPPLVRTGVSNFFGNMGDAWSAVNSLLQFHLQDAEENFARFHLNTMFGLFGIFDIASDVNIERHREDFGQTLGRWGVPSGPYLVLPVLGPSTLRDAAALPVDWHYGIINHFGSEAASNVAYALRAVDVRSNLLRVSNVLEEASLDKYSFTRDAYLQRRRSEVSEHEDDGEVPPPLPADGSDPLPAAKPGATPAAKPGRAPAPAGQQAPAEPPAAAPAR